MVKLQTLYLLFLILFISCKVGYEKLTYQRKPYQGNEIEMQGYYYAIDTVPMYEEPLGEPKDELVSRVYFFYRNGVMLHLNIPLSSFEKLEAFFKDTVYMTGLKKRPYGWGIFLVDDDSVKIETWVPSTGGKYPNFIYDLAIINDTTLYESDQDNIFHFRAFASKPDSVISYID